MQQGLVFRFLRRQLDSCSSVLLACDAGCLHSTTELNPADYGEREREIEISSPLARSLARLPGMPSLWSATLVQNTSLVQVICVAGFSINYTLTLNISVQHIQHGTLIIYF